MGEIPLYSTLATTYETDDGEMYEATSRAPMPNTRLVELEAADPAAVLIGAGIARRPFEIRLHRRGFRRIDENIAESLRRLAPGDDDLPGLRVAPCRRAGGRGDDYEARSNLGIKCQPSN